MSLSFPAIEIAFSPTNLREKLFLFSPFNHSRRQMKMLFGRRKMAKVLQLATASCVFKDEGGKKDRQTKKDCLTFINYTQSSFASRHSKKKTFLCSLSMLLLFFSAALLSLVRLLHASPLLRPTVSPKLSCIMYKTLLAE